MDIGKFKCFVFKATSTIAYNTIKPTSVGESCFGA